MNVVWGIRWARGANGSCALLAIASNAIALLAIALLAAAWLGAAGG
jgi:hypothetical protein